MSTMKSIADRCINLFTEPTNELKDVRNDLSWSWAFWSQIIFGLVLVIAWSQRVDWLALTENAMLSRGGGFGGEGFSAEGLERAVDFQEKWGMTFGIMGVLIGTPVATFLSAAVYWGIGRASFITPESPSYQHALVVASYSGFVLTPKTFLATLFCFIQPVGGLSPERLSPTTLSFWMDPENSKLKTLFLYIDPFSIFSLCIVYWGSIHVMGTSKKGAVMATLIPVLLIALRVYFAR